MNVNETLQGQVQQWITWYGDGIDGTCPTAEQWSNVLGRPADQPLLLVNRFRFREQAKYPPAAQHTPCSGREAFQRYAQVSMPTLERVGGRFLHVGPFAGGFISDASEWDLAVVASYPDLASLVALYSDAGYRQAYVHRVAACAQQQTWVCDG